MFFSLILMFFADGICGFDPKKKYRNIKSTNQNENFPKKSMFSTLKV
jgi:hypothetical protein